MSELQLGLIVVGAIVVVCVLAYNRWQERQYRRQAERDFSFGHRDVLLDAADAPKQDSRSGVPDAPPRERIEPTLQPDSMGPLPTSAGAAMLSEALDYIVDVQAVDELAGAALADAAQGVLARFGKPVTLEGYEEIGGRWEPLQREARYSRMRAGLQMVDRRGAVAAEDLALFAAAVQEAAAAVGALAIPGESREALRLASELDRFCGEVDIRIAVHVVAAGGRPLPGTKIRALAEAAGLALEQDGKFRRRDDEGRVIFDFGNREAASFAPDTMRSIATAGVTLELDVPRAPGGVRAFEQFRDFARQTAQALEGRIVDDNSAEIDPAAFEKILAQLAAVQRVMETRGISAGGPLALRLFS